MDRRFKKTSYSIYAEYPIIHKELFAINDLFCAFLLCNTELHEGRDYNHIVHCSISRVLYNVWQIANTQEKFDVWRIEWVEWNEAGMDSP